MVAQSRWVPVGAFFIIILVLALGLTACSQAVEEERTLSADDIAEDLQALSAWLSDTHPDLAHSVEPAALNAAITALRAELAGPHSVREAWMAMAVLNPLLNDAHMGVRYPQAAFEAYREAGGAAFTAPITVRNGRAYVAESIAQGSALKAGERIVSINGAPAEPILAKLLDRMRGETPRLRERVLSSRFDAAIWLAMGPAQGYRVEVEDQTGAVRRIRLDENRDVSGDAGVMFALDTQSTPPVMSVRTFDRAREDEFAAFLQDAFARLDAIGAQQLIIDIRDNGGGARQLSDRLLAYLTSERYTPISAVTARITPENQALIPGAQLGEVISTPFAQWVEPAAELPHRFAGEAVILIGPATYSQAIAFSATAQDFQIAMIAGTQTEGPASQTGQVQQHALPNSGLTALAPIYIFTRASGPSGRQGVAPDLPIDGEGRAQLEALKAALVEAD